jgi:hypothetical protein
MNTNIEVINENLWAVEFAYVNQGWIKDLSFCQTKPSDYYCFTKDGKIVLNKDQSYYKDMLKILNIIMKFRDEQLGTDKGFHFFLRIFIPNADNLPDQAFEKFIQAVQLDQLRKLFNQLSEVEKVRRKIHAEYIKGIKKPTGIDKIKKIFKRKGV